MASYPGTLSSFATHVNTTEIIDAGHPNLIQTELVAVENTLGLNPHISSGVSSSTSYVSTSNTFSTVSARLTNIEAGIVGDAHTQYMHLRGGDTITLTAPSIVGWAVQTSSGQIADVWQVFDSTTTKRAWLNASFQLNLTGGLNVTANGAVITGNTVVTGSIGAQQAVVSTPAVGGIGLIVNLFAGQTADALQIKNSTGTVLSKFDANGNLTVSNMTVTGTQTLSGTVIYNGQADLTAVSGTASGTGTGTGDKIELYSSGSSGVGFGYLTNRLVAYMPSSAVFAIRTASGSGNASSGSDAITLSPNGNIQASGTITANSFAVNGGLGGLSVDGSGNVSIKGPSTALKNNLGTVTYFTASPTGVSFDSGPSIKSYGADVYLASNVTTAVSAGTITVLWDTVRYNQNGAYTTATGFFNAGHDLGSMMYSLTASFNVVSNPSPNNATPHFIVSDNTGRVLWSDGPFPDAKHGNFVSFSIQAALFSGGWLKICYTNAGPSTGTILAQNDLNGVVAQAAFGVLR